MTLDLSVTMLVKDPPIDRLHALMEYTSAIASEFVIVDTGSPLGKLQAMARMNKAPFSLPKVVILQREWRDDFAWARNEGQDAVSRSWSLCLDPDELPTIAMMEHIRKVVTHDDQNPLAPGYLYWSVEYFDGVREPDREYQWHVRLFRSRSARWYRPLDELVELGGLGEYETRGTATLPKAPKNAYLIHSKDSTAIAQSERLYGRMRQAARD